MTVQTGSKTTPTLSTFDQVTRHIEFLEPEPPLGRCPCCGTELNSQLGPYSETAEMTRIKNGLLSLSEAELAELRSLLPATEGYDLARFVIGWLTRMRKNIWSVASRRAA